MLSWILLHVILALPMWVWTSLALVGLLVYVFAGFISSLPNFRISAELARVAGVAGMVAGIFMWGGAGVSAIYKSEIEEAQRKLDLAEARSKETNTKIEIEYRDKIKYLRGKTETIIVKIRDPQGPIVLADPKFQPGGQCEIPKEFYQALNEAARGPTK